MTIVKPLPCPKCGMLPTTKRAVLAGDGLDAQYGYRCVCQCGRASVMYSSSPTRAVRTWNAGIENVERIAMMKRVEE